MTAKALPKDLTSYDLLKSFAVILMILDHIGYCFYPAEMWFQALDIGKSLWLKIHRL